MLNVFILLCILASAALMLHPRVANAPLWRATITPLASIIGSGFLVLGPILDASFGWLAPLTMAGLCLCAHFFGMAIRYNIAVLDSGPRGRTEERMDGVASWALAFAYFISVAYYLNLFGAFAVSLTDMNDQFHARLVSSAAFLLILMVGWTRGFSALERLEQASVGIKLAIIAGMLAGLGWSFTSIAAKGALALNPPQVGPWSGLTLTLGLIVTVQGFETSRYLGAEYDAATRIRSMRLAQAVSAAIYMIYIALLTFMFPAGSLKFSETAIIDMMAVVAPILPGLLLVAALSAQFSAAIADTGGSGGLIVELSRGLLSARRAYALLAAIGLLLTWTANVFEIISYASRAFALYYGIQAAVAAVSAQRTGRPPHATIGFGALAALGLAIAVLGAPVE